MRSPAGRPAPSASGRRPTPTRLKGARPESARPAASGSAGGVVLLQDRPSLREEHPDAYLACADNDCGYFRIARAPQEKVHQMIAVDQDFLEVIPALAG